MKKNLKIIGKIKEEEAVFAKLWYDDIQSKKDKEDREAAIRQEKNQQVAAILKQQMQILDKQKQEEKRIRAETGKLMVHFLKFILIQKEKEKLFKFLK